MPTSPHSQGLPLPGYKRQRRDRSDKDHPKSKTPLPPWKRTKRPFKSAAEARAAYWGNLSKSFLTQSALNELDRPVPRVGQIAIEAQPELQSGDSRALSTQLKRAVRQGGLDLRHPRGVKDLPPKTVLDFS